MTEERTPIFMQRARSEVNETSRALHFNTHMKRRRNSSLVMSSAMYQPAEKALKSNTTSENGGLFKPIFQEEIVRDIECKNTPALMDFYGLTTSIEYSQVQSEEEAMGIAAEMSVDFYSEIAVLYDMVSDMKVQSNEAQSIDVLMSRIASRVQNDESLFVQGTTRQIHADTVKGIYQGLVRVCVFLYQFYYAQFKRLEMSDHLGLCLRRLIAFTSEYSILDPLFLKNIYEFVMVKIVKD